MKAHQLIRQYGWVQKQYGDRNVGFCLAGAIDAAYGCGVQALVHRLNLIDEIGAELSEWNDMEGRTQDEVIAVLEGLDI